MDKMQVVFLSSSHSAKLCFFILFLDNWVRVMCYQVSIVVWFHFDMHEVHFIFTFFKHEVNRSSQFTCASHVLLVVMALTLVHWSP